MKVSENLLISFVLWGIVIQPSTLENPQNNYFMDNEQLNLKTKEYPTTIGQRSSIFNHFGTLHTLEKLSFWAEKEKEINKLLKIRLLHLQSMQRLINRYLKSYEESSQKAILNSKMDSNSSSNIGIIIGSSAILSHLMISRYSTIVKDLRTFLVSGTVRANEEKLMAELVLVRQDEFNKLEWPNLQDLYLSHTAILKLHEIYGFTPEQFITKTMLLYRNYKESLKSMHSLKIGLFAFQLGFYYMAIEWLEFAKIQSTNEENGNKDLIDILLKVVVSEHNKIIDEGRHYQEDALNTFFIPTNIGEPRKERIRGRDIFFEEFTGKIGNDSVVEAYANILGLCNGNNYQSQSVKKRLKCYLERNRHPYFILNPVKTEQLSEYPYIIQMYDILGNDTVQEFYQAKGEMHLSTLSTLSDLKETLLHRSSAGVQINDKYFSGKINKISEMITGLKISKDDEPIQAVEYVYGRFCALHK